FKVIGHYLAKIILGLSITMILPVGIGLILGELNPAVDFLIAILATVIFSLILSGICGTKKDLNMSHGMVVVSLSWLVAMVLSAIPLYLSGHYKTFLDACFETMSGFTTTGLTLVQDLDHLSYAHNLWRHLGPFIGGQGIAIIALSFFIKGTGGAFGIYLGEARDEKLLPNVIHTARFIWLISIVYLILGTIALGLTGISIGMKPGNAFFHGICIFMAGFDTAGFAPQSQNILYYHSLLFEMVTIVIMIVGSFNFNLHYQLWIGNRKEIAKNVETKTFLISIMLTFFIVAVGLNQLKVYPQAIVLFRKGFFQLISGHTTTGYMTIYARQFITEWGGVAMFAMICAMALGGCICSTAGGIKMYRLGVIYKALREDIKRLLLPRSAIFYQKFHHIKTVFLSDQQIRSVVIITISYLVLYLIGTIAGMIFGYPLLNSLFESTSAAANVGLSCGITDTSMPAALKVIYIIQMWMGRLEFISVFALIGFFVTMIKGDK
ncbi:MAG: TrkH family potassium uptake protein, partial [Candidatus Omnitrophota bacterium]|nr:TrkH family potassium uptake protein [Candidatus Omnitrophota bacterium]